MRGIYTAAYLSLLVKNFARRREVPSLDLGKAFNLIAGTSTGAIIACALAAGTDLDLVVGLYRKHGANIFEKPLRSGGLLENLVFYKNLVGRRRALARGSAALRAALEECLQKKTLGEIWQTRDIALAIPAVDMNQHRGWVFKTPHHANSMGRDNDCSLVDACLASSAAPIYRSLASLDLPGGGGHKVFADGGLWANNPVLVALVDALDLTEEGDRIEVYCLGTCPRPAGQVIPKTKLDRTPLEWKAGAEAAAVGVDAQEQVYDFMAKKFASHLKRDCEIVRFPRGAIPASAMKYLDLDETRTVALETLVNQANTDAQTTNSRFADPGNAEAQLIASLFMAAPPRFVEAKE